MIFQPSNNVRSTPSDVGLDYEDVWLPVTEDSSVHGWFIPHGDSVKNVLFLHGNAGNISHRLSTIRMLHELGVNTIIIDYRGYGNSPGSPSEENMYADAQAAWHFLTRGKKIDPQDIVVFGRSLGGAVAVNLASKVRPGGLVLESTFTSMKDMGSNQYPYLPIEMLLKHEFDSMSRLSSIKTRTLVIHSREDGLVPFEMGRMLHLGLGPRSSFLEIEGGHVNGFIQSGERYRSALRDFLH